jgi:hypothetical protein
MYHFLDQPVARLSPGSRLVLRAMRCWRDVAVAPVCAGQPRVAEAGRHDALSLAADLQDLMLALDRHGLQPMRFAALDAAHITEAEALLLGLWADIVADRPEVARATLGLMVREPAINPIMAALTRVAAHLSTLGLAPAGRLGAPVD